MSNVIKNKRRRIADILSIKSHSDFHDYLLSEALDRYKEARDASGEGMGSALAICANVREALSFKRYGFSEIMLTGIEDPSPELLEEINGDPRIKYHKENSECLNINSHSYDLVVCKEGIHHLARPVLGVYEMLRVTRSAIILIEPAQTLVGRILEMLELSSIYERNQSGNIDIRDNYVYRWDVSLLKDLLNSYYLESGYTLDVTTGWLTSKFNAHPSMLVRTSAAIAGYLISWLPGSRGNYLSAVIFAGTDIPPDPVAIVQ